MRSSQVHILLRRHVIEQWHCLRMPLVYKKKEYQIQRYPIVLPNRHKKKQKNQSMLGENQKRAKSMKGKKKDEFGKQEIQRRQKGNEQRQGENILIGKN